MERVLARDAPIIDDPAANTATFYRRDQNTAQTGRKPILSLSLFAIYESGFKMKLIREPLHKHPFKENALYESRL